MINNPKAVDVVAPGGNVLTFGDILEFVLRHRYKLILMFVLGAAFALALAFMVPRQWEGKTVLQVGQVYYYSTTDQPQSAPVELPARTVERVKLIQFQDAILRRLGLPTELGVSREADLIRSSAAARLIRNADLIEITVRGLSPADAKRYVEAYQAELVAAHQTLAQPSFDRITGEVAQTERNLSVAEKRRQDLQKLVDEQLRVGASGKFSESVLLSDLVGKNDEELRRLRQQAALLREQASPQRTFNTRPIGELDVSKRAVWPKKTNFVAAGGIGGLLLGLVWALWQERRRRKAA